MRIIVIILLALTFFITGCEQAAKNTAPPTAKPSEQPTVAPTIDEGKTRILSDSLAKALIEDRNADVYARMEKPFRAATDVPGFNNIIDKMYAAYGKPLETEYKTTENGVDVVKGQKRPMRKYWYAVKTSKVEKGKYFLYVNTVMDGDSIACSGFGIADFSKGIPPQLK